MKSSIFAATAFMAALCAQSPAIAADISLDPTAHTFAWDGPNSFDNHSQSFDPVSANEIQFFGSDTGYGEGQVGPFAHSHGYNNLVWSLSATVDGVSQTVFTQALGADPFDPFGDGMSQELAALGPLSFAGGQVSGITFSCEDCSSYSFHQFSDASFSLANIGGAVPEPATWAMMIVGMSAVGFAMRRKMRESNAKFDAHIKAVTCGAAA